MFISEIMTKEVVTISPDVLLKDAAEVFRDKRISGIPVVNDDGRVVGIITLTDMLKALNRIYTLKELQDRVGALDFSKMRADERLKAKVRDIMTKEVYTMGQHETVDNLMRIMFTKNIHTIPVLDQGRIIGIVGKRDLIHACF
ncbi:MAG: CBS domain-containing protein [Candidatus Omnitrophica bacterium]|jgi:CBS domain-containing protein|nr:CBS domain-containing protein [Candidatus Omnitrophota bacterium]